MFLNGYKSHIVYFSTQTFQMAWMVNRYHAHAGYKKETPNLPIKEITHFIQHI